MCTSIRSVFFLLLKITHEMQVPFCNPTDSAVKFVQTHPLARVIGRWEIQVLIDTSNSDMEDANDHHVEMMLFDLDAFAWDTFSFLVAACILLIKLKSYSVIQFMYLYENCIGRIQLKSGFNIEITSSHLDEWPGIRQVS